MDARRALVAGMFLAMIAASGCKDAEAQFWEDLGYGPDGIPEKCQPLVDEALDALTPFPPPNPDTPNQEKAVFEGIKAARKLAKDCIENELSSANG